MTLHTVKTLQATAENANDLNAILHEHITHIVMYAEFVSNELSALYDCRNKVINMDLDHNTENKHLERIYTAMVRQYKADIKTAQVTSKTNFIVDMY